jgi:tetratricopeptide (TPR) repeat protein
MDFIPLSKPTPQDQNYLIRTYLRLADVLYDLVNYEEAYEVAKKAYQLATEFENLELKAEALLLAADISSNLGQQEEALQVTREALAILIPYFLRIPQTFANLMKVIVRNYRRRCEEATVQPDMDLLKPIGAKFQELEQASGS